MERIEKKIKYIDPFLARAEAGEGAGGEAVQSNITDHERVKITEAHGYIPGYQGIAIADSAKGVLVAAEALGSGAENEPVPAMLDALSETMQALSGEAEPLKGVIEEGDRGYCSEENLRNERDQC